MEDQAVSIAYLGPQGTYCDEAAHAFMGKIGAADAQLIPCTSFTDVFECVERGKSTYGVVATENALEGPVTATLDNFAFNSSAQILGVHVVDIHHCLIMHPNAKRADVRMRVDFPEACKRILHTHLTLPGFHTCRTLARNTMPRTSRGNGKSA